MLIGILTNFYSQIVESSSLVSVRFREAFSHHYISFFHLLVNGFSVTIYIHINEISIEHPSVGARFARPIKLTYIKCGYVSVKGPAVASRAQRGRY